jgi:hypothetical protein
MPHQNNAINVCAKQMRIRPQPRQCKVDIVLRSWPSMRRRKSVRHIDGEKALASCPHRNIVIKWASTYTSVATHECPAVQKNQHGAIGLVVLWGKDIQ